MEMQYSVHKYSRSFCSHWRAESSRSQKLRRESCGYCGAIPVSWLSEGANCILTMSWHLCGVRTGNGGGAVRFARFTAHDHPSRKAQACCAADYFRTGCLNTTAKITARRVAFGASASSLQTSRSCVAFARVVARATVPRPHRVGDAELAPTR